MVTRRFLRLALWSRPRPSAAVRPPEGSTRPSPSAGGYGGPGKSGSERRRCFRADLPAPVDKIIPPTSCPRRDASIRRSQPRWAHVVPYEVNSPLWSDSANKERGFAIPSGKKIHVKNCAAAPAACTQGPADTGRWVMPVGTVMVKNFGFDGKLVETRLFVHPDANVERLQLPVERGADRGDAAARRRNGRSPGSTRARARSTGTSRTASIARLPHAVGGLARSARRRGR